MKTYGSAGSLVAATGGHVPLPLAPRPTGRDILTDLERAQQRQRKVLPPLTGPEPTPDARRARGPAGDIRREFIAPYLAGHTLERVARDHKAGKDTVRRHLLLAGIVLRDDRKNSRRHRTPIDEARLVELLAAGMLQRDIAAELGCTRQSLNRRIQALRKAERVAS